MGRGGGRGVLIALALVGCASMDDSAVEADRARVHASAVEAGDVAVRLVPDEAIPVADSWLRGVAVDGPASPGGELVARLFLVPPEQLPLDTVLHLEVGAAALTEPLLHGEVELLPGLPQRPLVRHRARMHLPGEAPGSEWTLRIGLRDASTGTTLYQAPEVQVPVGKGLPTLEDLARVTATRDEHATFEDTRVRPVLVRTTDGYEERKGPPLPRVVREEAWPVVVGGVVDPTGWDRRARVDPEAPLRGVSTLLADATASVVSWGAPATREAPAAEGVVRPRRAVPEALAVLHRVGVDGVLLAGPHTLDAGEEGLRQTEDAARMFGLRTAGTPERPALFLPLGDSGLVAAVVSARFGQDLRGLVEEVAGRRAQVVLVAVDPDGGEAAAVAEAVARSGADGGWVLSDEPGPLDVVDGVPVLHGLPPLLEQAPGAGRSSLVTRWYLDRHGVMRVDLLPVTVREGAVERDRSPAAADLVRQVAAASRPLGTDVRVGEQVGAVDVRGHAVRTGHWVEEFEPPPPAPAAIGLPAAELPERCRATGASGEGTPLGGGALTLVSHRLLTSHVTGGEPIIAELVWRGEGALEPGAVEWSLTGAGVPWRARTVPCEGSWGLEDLRPGQAVLDRVALWPPEGARAGEITVEVAVRAGDEVLAAPDGARRVKVGSATLAESP